MFHIRTPRTVAAVAVLALAALLLGGCANVRLIPVPVPVAAPQAGAEAAAPAAPAAASDLEGVTWGLTSYAGADGAAVEPVADASLTFADGTATGTAGCNRLIAAYTVDGNNLSIKPGPSTMMACEEAVMAQESAVVTNLGNVATYAVSDGTLELSDAAGNVVLTFAEVTPLPLVGTPWQATMVNNNNQAVTGVIEGSTITANFNADGTLTGSAGCNNYFAGYTVDGSNLTVDQAGSTMMACEEPTGVMEQETAYLQQIVKAATYAIDGDTLEIRDADGALIASYVAMPEVVEPTSADPDPVDETAAPVEVAPAAASAPSGTVVAPLGVNVRIGPGTVFPAVGVAPEGTTGEIIGRSEDGAWWAARVAAAPNETGWVAAAYVEATGAADVPVLPAPALPEQTAALQPGTAYPIAPGTILYSASRVVQEGNRVYELEDIYAVPAQAGATPTLVANNAMQPAVSPDRNTLAMHSTQSDKLGLGGFDVNSGNRLRFSAFIEDESPRWSPSGDRLVFASNRQGDRRWRIYITPAVDHERPVNMTYTELDFGKDPDWHPSQELLIVKGCDWQGQNCGLYTLGTDGSNRTLFTNEASDSMPRWLPDGSGVVFMSEGRDGNWEIYRADATGQNVTRLTNDPAPDGLPAVSPDGSQIAFISKRGGTWGLWVMPVAGGDPTLITPIAGDLPDWLVQAVDWAR